MTRITFIFVIFIFFVFAACNNAENADKNSTATNTAVTINATPAVINCDTFRTDRQPVKDYKKALNVWLEDSSLDWFLEKRQSAWREAKAWHNKTFAVDSNAIVQCLCTTRKNVFLYIPNHFYIREKNGNEYFLFYIVNNSSDTVEIPCLDAIINNISSSVSYPSKNDTLQQWLVFQGTCAIVECGNSRWTRKLPPHTAIESEIESDYTGMGDTTVDYRLELRLGKQLIISNSIKINLMKKQLPYLGKSITLND